MRPTPIARHQHPEGVQGEHPQGERSERPTNAGKAGPGVPAASGKRSVPEWVGKVPDAPIPPRVRLRIFEAHGGICALTGRKIMPGDEWDCDHITALANGGEHREGNLQPVLRAAHREKTRADVAIKAKADRVRKKHLGIKTAKAKIPGSRGSGFRKPLNGPAYRVDE